jgi:hypothetical protein
VVLASIESEGRLADAARALVARLSETPKRPRALLDAVLTWVVRESAAFRAAPPARALLLVARPADWALVTSAALPLLAIALG